MGKKKANPDRSGREIELVGRQVNPAASDPRADLEALRGFLADDKVAKSGAALAPAGGVHSPRSYASFRDDTSEHSGIDVGITTCFKPRYSAPDDRLFTFGYKVEFVNTCSEPVELCSRHWQIIDLDGNEFEVAAPTIAGKDSTLLPPKQRWSYDTAVPLRTPGGRMKGFFIGDTQSFRTPERMFEFDKPTDEELKECGSNRANDHFVRRMPRSNELEIVDRFLRCEGELDTRQLDSVEASTRYEFERLLLQRFLGGYRVHQIAWNDIADSFPVTIPIWDIGFREDRAGTGIYIFKEAPKVLAVQDDNRNNVVVPFPYSALQTRGAARGSITLEEPTSGRASVEAPGIPGKKNETEEQEPHNGQQGGSLRNLNKQQQRLMARIVAEPEMADVCNAFLDSKDILRPEYAKLSAKLEKLRRERTKKQERDKKARYLGKLQPIQAQLK